MMEAEALLGTDVPPSREQEAHDALLLLQDPARIAERCSTGTELEPLVRTSLVCIAVGASLFGAALGSFHGGVQILLAAIKLPLVLFLTLVVFAPGLFALSGALGRSWSLGTVVAISTSTVARASLVLAALAPLLWFGFDVGFLDYHSGTCAAVIAAWAALWTSLSILWKCLSLSWRDAFLAAAAAALFAATFGQASWVLRPYLLRPRATDVVVLRAPEGSFIDAVFGSTRSAAGIYDEEHVQ